MRLNFKNKSEDMIIADWERYAVNELPNSFTAARINLRIAILKFMRDISKDLLKNFPFLFEN